MQVMQQKREDEAARRQAKAQLYERQAGKMGFPTDQLDAARFNQQFAERDKAQKQQALMAVLKGLAESGGSEPEPKPNQVAKMTPPDYSAVGAQTNTATTTGATSSARDWLRRQGY